MTVVADSESDSGLRFQWLDVTGASRFYIWIQATDGRVIFRDENITETHFVPNFQFDSGSYRVWVKAISSSNNWSGIWSNQASFIVAKIDDDSMNPKDVDWKEITVLRTQLVVLQPHIPSNQATVIAEPKRLPDQNSVGSRTNEDADDHMLEAAADSDESLNYTPSATDLIMAQVSDPLAVTLP